MLTNNWRYLITKCLAKTSKSKTYSGKEGQLSSNSLPYTHKLRIGTGTTEAKASDYKLESPIDEANYISSQEVICPSGGGAYDVIAPMSVSGTITNTSNSPLEVSEIGLTAASNNTDAEDGRYLLAREVFDTPITILPGGVQAFSLRLF